MGEHQEHGHHEEHGEPAGCRLHVGTGPVPAAWCVPWVGPPGCPTEGPKAVKTGGFGATGLHHDCHPSVTA